MKKIRINKLPEGFEIIKGTVVKKMQYGGMSTGDQFDYSLVTHPTNVTSKQMSDDEAVDVRYSLSSVPREEANIEAEGGETVLTDLNNDGNFGLYDIKGPRHKKGKNGGVPLFLPEQSFIFSDTNSMKMKGDDLAQFGIETKKSMTPAKISKKFQLNQFYGAMDDEFADEMGVKSAEIMLGKNKMNLSKLAFGQELNKKFDDGVPLASHPYLVSIGEDPIEFTARIENINKQQAMMKALAALPPEQQQQVLALQQFMAQTQQMQQSSQQTADGAPTPPSGNEQMMMAQQSVPGGPMSNGEMPMAKFGTELKMYQEGDEITNDRQDTNFDYIGGSPEFNEYYQNDPDYRKRLYEVYKIEMNKVGKTPIKETEFHKVYLGAQRRNYELGNYAEKYNKQNNLNPGDQGYIDIQNEAFDKGYNYADTKGGKSVDHAVSPELKNLIKSYNEDNLGTEGFVPLTVPTKDETYTFQQGYRGNLYLEAGEQYKRKKEGKDYDEELLGSFFSTGANDQDSDKSVLNPYWKQGDPENEKFFKGISKPDSRYGNTTLGQKSRIIGAKTFTEPEVEDPIVAPVPGDIGEERFNTDPEFWKQDMLKMQAINQRKRRLGLPYQPTVENIDIDYVLEDPTRAVAAVNEQYGLATTANNMFSGPQAGSSRNLAFTGETMDNIANVVGGVQARNVSTVNTAGGYQQAMLDAATNREQRDRNVKLYDDTETVLQRYMDEKNFDREQYADAYSNALTNRANTFNLNSIQDYYQIDPTSGGMIGQFSSKAFDPVQQTDPMEQYFNLVARFERNGIKPPKGLYNDMMGRTNSSNQTNIQQEYNNLNSPKGKKGKEMKKYATPFYTGKIGI